MLLTEFLDSQGANWEAQQASGPSDLPPPPATELPVLPPPTTSCDLEALSSVLGPQVAAALKAQLGSTEVAALLSTTLADQKARLTTYAAQVDAQIEAATAQLTVLADAQALLGEAQTTLHGLQDLIDGSTAAAIKTACPAAGYLLGLAGGALTKVDTQLTGKAAMLSGIQEKLTSLQAAKTATDSLLAELDTRLDALPGLLAVFHA